MAIDRSLALHHLHAFPVEFQGFRASVGDLYRKGWAIETYYEARTMLYEASIHNKDLRMLAYLDRIDLSLERGSTIYVTRIIPQDRMVFRACEAPVITRLQPAALDADSRAFHLREFRLCDLLVPEQKTQELIVDPADVQAVLDQVIAAQRPKQKELREKARDKTILTEAKIVSFIDYAQERR